MIEAFVSDDVRAGEKPLLDAGVDLMGQAAYALAGVVRDVLRSRVTSVRGARVTLLVGAGNNGGDALYAGVTLRSWGARVRAVVTSDKHHGAGLAALLAAGGDVVRTYGPGAVWRGDAVADLFAADVIVDGLLGNGAKGEMREPEATLVAMLAGLLAADDSGTAPVVVAVDLPSGMGVNDGELPGVVLPADVTVTFGAIKPGLLLPPAEGAVVGDLVPVDIGLDFTTEPVVRRLEPGDVAALWTVPGAASQKYTRGVVGLVTGCSKYPGAALLSATAAVRSGAGLVRYLGEPDVARLVVAARPEVVPAEGQVQAWVLGSGVDPSDGVQAGRIRDVLRALAVPAVVDAGALALLPDVLDALPADARRLMVLTPHAGELADLLGAVGERVSRADVEAGPLRWLRRAVELTGSTVLLKGSTTLVAAPDGTLFSQADGTAWLATAGSGDVLAGLLGTALAATRAHDVPLVVVAAAAALVHGRAGVRAAGDPAGPIAALDIAGALPRVIAQILAGH